MPDRPTALSRTGRIPSWLPPLFYLLLSMLFLWRSTFTGEVFLPAGLLGRIFPYAAQIHSEALPPWNPLRWDGIAQFYPWRHFAAQTLHSGMLPLWNPYQFCGTPFVANSQSAVFYPGNLLFYLLPTAQAFGFSALLHLTLCGWFSYLLLRRLHCTHTASLLGGAVFAFCSWQVAWLQLPTFLATSCWIPLLLRQVHQALSKHRGRALLTDLPSLSASVGCMLLAGHLQIAFYGLLAGSLWAVALLLRAGQQQGAAAAWKGLCFCIAALALGLLLALPQILPAVELSRRSHRVSTPTAAGYAAYKEYALPLPLLATLTLPDLFGSDSDPGNPYWGFYTKRLPNNALIAIRHNTAETALYIGIVPLLLALLALTRAFQSGPPDFRTLFFGLLALLALLLALGTPVNALFYFGIPGFGQSGSPARVLVLWSFAMAALAAFGLDRLRASPSEPRERLLLPIGLLFLMAIGLSFTSQAIGHTLPGFRGIGVPTLGEAFQRIGLGWLRLALMAAGGLVLLLPIARRHGFSPPEKHSVPKAPSSADLSLSGRLKQTSLLAPAALVLVLGDLFSVGIGANSTASAAWVYPETEGIRTLRAHLGHERVFPVNQRWSLYKSPPTVLPPNGAMVYGFRDVQGYDSLLTGRYKAFADRFALPNAMGAKDASPPEVGNMVFFQDPTVPIAAQTGASFVATLPIDAPEFGATVAPSNTTFYQGAGEMALYSLPGALPRARLISTSGGDSIGTIRYLQDAPTRVSLDLNVPAPSTLVLADQIYPGWQVSLDGKPTRFDTASPLALGIFRALPVASGPHRVLFHYTPTSFRLGLYLALFASLLLLTLVFAGPTVLAFPSSR